MQRELVNTSQSTNPSPNKRRLVTICKGGKSAEVRDAVLSQACNPMWSVCCERIVPANQVKLTGSPVRKVAFALFHSRDGCTPRKQLPLGRKIKFTQELEAADVQGYSHLQKEIIHEHESECHCITIFIPDHSTMIVRTRDNLRENRGVRVMCSKPLVRDYIISASEEGHFQIGVATNEDRVKVGKTLGVNIPRKSRLWSWISSVVVDISWDPIQQMSHIKSLRVHTEEKTVSHWEVSAPRK
ncbi:hypothetical protein BJV74DRAFT_799277 [Russula compacta]|nr:hypothetical protein BJV74DRAFT_799277 [Russula compacta]